MGDKMTSPISCFLQQVWYSLWVRWRHLMDHKNPLPLWDLVRLNPEYNQSKWCLDFFFSSNDFMISSFYDSLINWPIWSLFYMVFWLYTIENNGLTLFHIFVINYIFLYLFTLIYYCFHPFLYTICFLSPFSQLYFKLF